MKIKILNTLLIVDILTAVAVASIFYVHSNALHIILGLPFLLLFPGYALLQALFPKNEGMDGVETLALSSGMSIAVVAIIGFGLDYTQWGIKAEAASIGISVFTYLMSVIAWIRKVKLKSFSLITVYNIEFPSWEGSALNKIFSVFLIVLILCAGGILGYTTTLNKNKEAFTEFYFLGINGQAKDYPSNFIMVNGQVTNVIYGTESYQTDGQRGEVTLGIVNHEEQKVSYVIKILLNNVPLDVIYIGSVATELGSIELQPGETWEQTVGFIPENLGDNQKLEFLLFKGDDTEPGNSLQLVFNVSETLTDFYMLGFNGAQQDYLSEFVIQDGVVAQVRYGSGPLQPANGWGEVTLVILNHEREGADYVIKITMNGEPVNIYYDGQQMNELNVTVNSSTKWEQSVGFRPSILGHNQAVGFILYEKDGTDPIDTLNLSVNVD